MARAIDCAGRSDARLKVPTPAWCHELPAVQCERHYVHFKRERRACQLESHAGRCSLGTACLANFSGTSGTRKQEGALHRAAMRWLESMHPEVIAAGQPGMRIKQGFPDLFLARQSLVLFGSVSFVLIMALTLTAEISTLFFK